MDWLETPAASCGERELFVALLSEKKHELSNCLVSIAEVTTLFFTFAQR